MRQYFLVISVLATGVAAVLSGRREPGPMSPITVFAQEDLISWRQTSEQDSPEVRAEQRSSVSAVRPYFDRVRLEQISAADSLVCGNFPPPVLYDEGTSRTWVYSMPKASGSCALERGGSFVSVGVRGTAETRAEPVR